GLALPASAPLVFPTAPAPPPTSTLSLHERSSDLVDHCARLCHSSSVTGLGMAFGSGAMTNTIRGLRDADCILITGSNTAESHPRSEEHTSELQSRENLVCRLLLEKKKQNTTTINL